MNKKTLSQWFTFVAILLMTTAQGALAQALTVADFTLTAGETKDVTINLDRGTQNAIYGVQTDLVLPEGVTLTADPTAVAGAMDEPIVSYNAQNGRITMFTQKGTAFTADATAIITLSLKAADTFEGGTLQLKNSKLTTSIQAGEISVDPCTAQVTVPAGSEVLNYVADFNTEIRTSDHAFKVASNWRHIVDTYTDYYDAVTYLTYKWDATTGVDGSGALYCMTNQNSNSTYDLLVTPVVKGTVTIQAKRYASYYTPQLSFYKIVDAGNGKFTRGDLIDVTLPEFSTTEFVTVTIPVAAEGERIGIRSSYLWLDNFTASSAIIEKEKSIMIASAEPTATTGTIYWEQQPNGKVLVKYTVTVTNNGEMDLTEGMDGFSISIINGDTEDVYATVNVPQNLAIGETSEPFEVSAEVETSLWPSNYIYKKMWLRENLMGSVVERAQSHYKAYEPKFVFRLAESTSTNSITAAEAWGLISEATTKAFEIANTGTAPLTIKSITLPTGFESDNAPEIPAEGLVIAKGATQALNITQPATQYGNYSGELIIVYLDKDGAEQTYKLEFSANYLNPNTWTADFNNTTSTILYPEGAIAEAGITNDYQYVSSGNYNNSIKGYNTSSYATANNKFITPKLHANAGDQMTFDVKAGYSSDNDYFVKVYVSQDRQTWGDPVATYTYNDDVNTVGVGSSFTNKSITFDTEGDYYVAFAIYGSGSGIDNLIGLEKVAVAHDLYIKSVNWPDASIKSGVSQSKPTIDIIPLTNETADAYTVKYVCGETVLAEATPVALTASANRTNTFSFSWTPTVEQTTTYEGTKIVIAFTDGTTFESEAFDLTVTNEAIFHFVNSIPTSKWYEPTDRTAPITFPKTNTADVQTFYLYNWGSKALTVNSISLPEGFTTDVEFPLTVAAFDETNLNAAAVALPITFSATEPGDYGGELVITYETDKTFTLAISGAKLDPEKWYANFGTEANQWPAGSVYQSNVSTTYVSTGNYSITSSSETDNFFITPKLAAKAGDKLSFDACLYSSGDYYKSGAVKVYAAATREALIDGSARTELIAVNGSDETDEAKRLTADYQTFDVTLADAGDFYIGFEISNRAKVDEIYGLKVAQVAHDWKIVSSSIPTDAMQNVLQKATINLANFGLEAEEADSYYVNLYINGELTQTVMGAELPTTNIYGANGTANTIEFRYATVGTFPVYIEVKTDDYSVKTEPVEVTFAEEVAVAEAIAIGTKTSTNKSYAFIDLYNMDNYDKTSDILYTAARLQAFGIKAGDKITKIAFRGTSPSARTMKNDLKGWYGLSTGSITPGSPVKDNMTEFVLCSSENPLVFPNDQTEVAIELAEPLVYDGTSDLRLYFEGTKLSQNWANFASEYDSDDSNMYWNGSTTALYTPLLYVTLAAEPAVFSGTVKDEAGAPIKDAVVALISEDGDDVEYFGQTDAEGAFSFNVIQTARTYAAFVKAEGYAELTEEGISFAEGNVDMDFVLKVDYSTFIANRDFEGDYSVYYSPKSDRDIYQPEGWTVTYENGEENDMTALNSDCKAWDSFSGRPQLGEDGGNNTYWVRFRWGNSESLTLSQEVTLPAGDYKLTADAFFNGAKDANGAACGSATISAAGQSTAITGNSTWDNYAVRFSLTEETAVTIALNVKQTQQVENIAAFDNFAIETIDLQAELLAEALDDLEAEIETAEAMKTDARTEGLDDFNNAISDAEQMLQSEDVEAIRQAITDLQAAEQAFYQANLPMQPGTYYVYNAYADKFLSRGMSYGTRAIVDNYGVPVTLELDEATETYRLKNATDNRYYGDDFWMYADVDKATNDRTRSYKLEAVDGGFYLHNTARDVADNRVYVYMKDDNNKWAVAGNAILNDNISDEAQCVWQFVTADFRNRKVAEMENAAKAAAFEAAGLSEDDELAKGEATGLTFKTGSTWTGNKVNGWSNDPATNDNGTEAFEWAGTYTQNVENLAQGLYEVSIQAFYRPGINTQVAALYDQGFTGVNATFDANGTVIQLTNWAKDRSDMNPNGMGTAAASFAEGKYIATGYAYVGEDGKLSLTVTIPAVLGSGWFMADNVTYAKVEKAALQGDANGDGQVTTADASAVINIVMSGEEPTAEQLTIDDMNGDQKITTADAVAIVTLAMQSPAPAPSRDMSVGNSLSVRGNEVMFRNNDEFVAFQMDVTLADDAQLNGVQLGDRVSGHQVTWQRLDSNTYPYAVFSLQNDAIMHNNGALLRLDVSGSQEVNVSNVEFADTEANSCAVALDGVTTGIDAIGKTAGNADYYNAAGVRSDKAHRGLNIVRKANGHTEKVVIK